MNLLLRPLEDTSDPVWSIIISIVILLCAVLYIVVYILGIDRRETNGSNGSAKQEELLQLQSDQDQQGS